MRRKKVWRYYCEFCKKSGGHAYWMRKHEAACTANPDRVCGMCELCADGGGASLEELMACLPDGHEWDRLDRMDYLSGDESSRRRKESLEGLSKMRELTNCPACLLAAIRQRGMTFYCGCDVDWEGETGSEGFDWKKERQACLDAYVPDHGCCY